MVGNDTTAERKRAFRSTVVYRERRKSEKTMDELATRQKALERRKEQL